MRDKNNHILWSKQRTRDLISVTFPILFSTYIVAWHLTGNDIVAVGYGLIFTILLSPLLFHYINRRKN